MFHYAIHLNIGSSFSSSSSSSSSSDVDSPPATAYTTSPVIIAFTLAILVCFFVGFCLIYFCRCCLTTFLYSWASQRPASGDLVHRVNSPTGGASPYRGLDPSLLQIFPTFPYASVKEFHGKNKSYSLECAICLLEFEDDSFLRLLTVCCHVFHQECIDLWLGTHKTCPVCRTDLDSPTEKCQTTLTRQSFTENNNVNETRIDVKDEEDERQHHQQQKGVSTSQQVREQEGEGGEDKWFSRSHSTGHSIVVIRGEIGRGGNDQTNDEKYTLRLPEHIQAKLIRGHNYAKSCATYKEMASLCSKCSYAEAISGSTSCGNQKV